MNTCEWIALGIGTVMLMSAGISLTIMGLIELQKKGWW